MGIGQNITIGTDDEARAKARAFIFIGIVWIRWRIGRIREIRYHAAEVFQHGVFFATGALVSMGAGFRLGRLDTDHCRALFIHQFGEVWQ